MIALAWRMGLVMAAELTRGTWPRIPLVFDRSEIDRRRAGGQDHGPGATGPLAGPAAVAGSSRVESAGPVAGRTLGGALAPSMCLPADFRYPARGDSLGAHHRHTRRGK